MSDDEDSLAPDPCLQPGVNGENRARAITGIGRAIDIAVGRYFACALRADRSVTCWGVILPTERAGDIGLVEGTVRDVAEMHNAVAIDARDGVLCAVTHSGAVVCAGDNHHGQLGAGHTNLHTTPVRIAELSDIRSVSVARDAVCALTEGGAARCWGHNAHDKFGVARARPKVRVVPGLRASRLMLADDFSCANSTTGDPLCWGKFNIWRVDSDAYAQSIPAPIPVIPARDLLSVVGVSWGRCTLQTDGLLRCWSRLDSGRPPTPVVVMNEVTQVVTSRDRMTCARKRDGSVWCWSVAGGHPHIKNQPVEIRGMGPAVAITAAAGHACAVTRSGALWCWDSRIDSIHAARISGVDDALAVAGNAAALCVRTRAQRVRCRDRAREQSTWRDMGLADVADLLATVQAVCVRTFAGRVWCWNGTGTRAAGPSGSVFEPGPYDRPLVELRAGHNHLCGRRSDGRVVCWGDNRESQLGAVRSSVVLTPTPAFLSAFYKM